MPLLFKLIYSLANACRLLPAFSQFFFSLYGRYKQPDCKLWRAQVEPFQQRGRQLGRSYSFLTYSFYGTECDRWMLRDTVFRIFDIPTYIESRDSANKEQSENRIPAEKIWEKSIKNREYLREFDNKIGMFLYLMKESRKKEEKTIFISLLCPTLACTGLGFIQYVKTQFFKINLFVLGGFPTPHRISFPTSFCM